MKIENFVLKIWPPRVSNKIVGNNHVKQKLNYGACWNETTTKLLKITNTKDDSRPASPTTINNHFRTL